MSKSFLNEAFDRKFGFKDISDEVKTEKLKRPKRRKYSEAVINEGTSNFWSMDELPLLVFMPLDEVTEEDDYDESVVLDEQDVIDLESDVDDFNHNMKISDVDEEGEYNIPKVEIKPGYYRGAQLYCDTYGLSKQGVEEVTKFFDEMKNKYSLTELIVAYRFSNGETGYQKIESLSKRHKAINEADYGGAYDIDPSQYFTRDDINEFAECVVDAINAKSYSKATLVGSYVENNVVEVTVEWDGNEATATQKIDMRKIRRPQQIDKYVKPISDELIRQLKEVGFDAGSHLSNQDYPLDEAFGIDDEEFGDILGGFIDMGYSDEEAERKINNNEYIYFAGVTTDEELGEEYISVIGSIQDAVSNWRYYIDEYQLRNDLSYDIDEYVREDAEEAVKQAHEDEDESDYDFDKEVEDWIEDHRDEYLDNEVYNYIEMVSSKEAESYFDYEAFGRDLRYDGWFFTDNGALYIE